MMDDTYGTDSSNPTPEFKPCPVCGIVDCEAHADHPLNQKSNDYLEKFAQAMRDSSIDLVKHFGDTTGADVDEAMEALANKESALLHTGTKNTYKEIDEEEEQDEDGEEEGTIKFSALPPPVAALGANILYRNKEEKDRSTAGGHFKHLDNINDAMTTSAWKGQPHSFRLFRAKKGILP